MRTSWRGETAISVAPPNEKGTPTFTIGEGALAHSILAAAPQHLSQTDPSTFHKAAAAIIQQSKTFLTCPSTFHRPTAALFKLCVGRAEIPPTT